jgi:two-component system, cell cycle sensor histidine kinase and response regulator CckA
VIDCRVLVAGRGPLSMARNALDNGLASVYPLALRSYEKQSTSGGAVQSFGATDLSTILDEMREGLQIIDREWRYAYLNRAAAEHGQRPREELVGRTMMECYPGIDETELFALLRRCMQERTSSSMTNEFTYPDGMKRTFELRIAPSEMGIVVLTIDITEGRKLEAQYRHAQKMEAIGRLAGSVAHDFNNSLSVILSYASMLLADLKPVDPIRDDLEAIRKAGERAAELTRQLLAFSRQQALSLQVTSLNKIVFESERMLRRLVGEDIELVVRLDRESSLVNVDPGQIDQVIMNLAINARDAMPNGGKLTIETKDVELDESYATEHFDVSPGRYVMLAVSDTGIGMSKETQAHIFEPFFTTKEVGKGTGLGLATVFGIVQQCGGNIWVYSEPGNGTTFRIYLPQAEEVEPSSHEVIVPMTLEGTETILLVEDQDEVRQVALHILRRFGYHVIEARNAGEALLTCERHPRAIHLLLTDVVMPQMNGRELAERLLKIRPDMRVLYMSGYTEDAIVRHGVLDSGIAYLQKPFEPEKLARRVREVLEARPRNSIHTPGV